MFANFVATVYVVVYTKKSGLVLFGIVCLDAYTFAVVFSSRRYMDMEDNIQAMYNKLTRKNEPTEDDIDDEEDME